MPTSPIIGTPDPHQQQQPPAVGTTHSDERASTAALPVIQSATTGIQVSENTDPAVGATAYATSVQEDHPKVFTHKFAVTWRGVRYLVTKYMVVDKKPKEGSAEAFSLGAAIEKGYKIYLDQLSERIYDGTYKGPIQPGKDLNVLFTDDGFTTYIPKQGTSIDATNTVDDILQGLHSDSILEVKTKEAKELSRILQLDKGDGTTITEKLNKSDELKKYQQQPAQATVQPLKPIGLPNPKNLCHLNTAFQLLATNPVIRKALLQEGVIKGGTSNPLYQALKLYDEAQAPTKPASPINLQELKAHLGIGDEQEDAQDTFCKLLSELNEDKNSPLYTLVQTQLGTKEGEWQDKETSANPCMLAQKTINIDPAKSFQEQIDQPGKLDPPREKDGKVFVQERQDFKPDPGVLAIHVKRTQFLSDKLPEYRTAYLNLLQKKEIKGLISSDDFTLLQGQRTPQQETALVEKLQKIDEVKKLITEAERCILERITLKKIDQAIDVSSEIPGKELTSFSSHLGAEGGHYITYVKDGDKYWKISDKNVDGITKGEFETKVKTASTLIYTKKDLLAPVAAKGDAPSASTNKPLVALNRIPGTNTSVGVDLGTITEMGPEYAIVCPANHILYPTGQGANKEIYDAIPDLISHVTKAKADVVAQKWLGKLQKMFGKTPTLSLNPGVVVRTDGIDKIPHVLHVVLPEHLTKEDVQMAVKSSLKKALELRHLKVGLPLLSEQPNPKDVLSWMNEAIKAFAEDNASAVHPLQEIKIVVTSDQNAKISAKPPVRKTSKTTKVHEVTDKGIKYVVETVDSDKDITSQVTTKKDKVAFLRDVEEIIADTPSDKTEITLDLRKGVLGTEQILSEGTTPTEGRSFDTRIYTIDPKSAVEAIVRANKKGIKTVRIVVHKDSKEEYKSGLTFVSSPAPQTTTSDGITATHVIGTVNEKPISIMVMNSEKIPEAVTLTKEAFAKALDKDFLLISTPSRRRKAVLFDLRPGTYDPNVPPVVVESADSAVSFNINEELFETFLAKLAACTKPECSVQIAIPDEWYKKYKTQIEAAVVKPQAPVSTATSPTPAPATSKPSLVQRMWNGVTSYLPPWHVSS